MPSILPFFAVALAATVPDLAAEPIALPRFDSVELNGGGEVTIVPGRVERVTLLNGSTQFTSFRVVRGGKLEITTRCDSACPQRYNPRVRVESPRVPDVAVRAGGTIVAGRGFAPQHDLAAAISAGGMIDLRAVPADAVSAAINAGGDIYVRPRLSLSAAINAGGDIHYSGRPRVSTAVHNGGAVSRDD